MLKRAEKIETAIENVTKSYFLDKAFVRGLVRDNTTGEKVERWCPRSDLLQKYYSQGEAIAVAILLDAFHDEYGLIDYLDNKVELEPGQRPAEMIWPGIKAFRSLGLLDSRLKRVVASLM